MKTNKIWKTKNFTINFLNLFIIFLFFSNIVNAGYNSQTKTYLNESQKIKELTWSVLKYDHIVDSRNYGTIYTPKPMVGLLLVLSNMMSKRVCKEALSIYDENRMDLLINLKNFCIKNMKIFLFDYYKIIFIHNIVMGLSGYYSSSRATAEEMILLGDRPIKDWFYGFCLDQSCFNTAMLRLCGVPPEEVFNVNVPYHGFTVIKIDDQWYAFDSTRGRRDKEKKYIYDKSDMNCDYFSSLENDKYFINFKTHEEEIVTSMLSNYSNMEPNLLIDTITGIQTLLNNPKLGSENCDIYDFVNNSVPYPHMKNVSVPYTIHDAIGETNEEKANNLADIIQRFVENQSDINNPNQYDRCLYSLGVFPSKYPQAYANAAKYGVVNSNYANLFDSRNQNKDIRRTALWVNLGIKTRKISEENHVYNSELLWRIKKGSTIDKALVSYGTLRNMKKDKDFWSPDDLFILVTKDNEGYLAVNHSTKGWIYLNFGRGLPIQKNIENINFAFNEKVKLDEWIKLY